MVGKSLVRIFVFFGKALRILNYLLFGSGNIVLSTHRIVYYLPHSKVKVTAKVKVKVKSKVTQEFLFFIFFSSSSFQLIYC